MQLVRAELAADAAVFAVLVRELSDRQLERVLVFAYPEPAERTVDWLVRHTAHEGEHHLVDGGRGNGKEALDVCFCGRFSDDKRIGVNEGRILALLVGKAGGHGVHVT